jgi:magnesium-transporting ATPase (P-type)
MKKTGTDLAKEASYIVLLDDKFSSIITSVL